MDLGKGLGGLDLALQLTTKQHQLVQFKGQRKLHFKGLITSCVAEATPRFLVSSIQTSSHLTEHLLCAGC